MPKYNVIKKGFFGGSLYDPDGKRRVLHTDKSFPMKGKVEQVPSWLEAVKGDVETAAQAKARKSAATKAANAAAKQAADDKQEIADASFMGDGESTASQVETL